MTAKVEFREEELIRFNASQNEKIIHIRKRRNAEHAQKTDRRRRRRSAFKTVVILVIIGCVAAYSIYIRAAVNAAEYNLFNLKAEAKGLAIDAEELQSAIESQTELNHIEKVAVEALNMKYPTNDQIVYIDNTAHFALGEKGAPENPIKDEGLPHVEEAIRVVEDSE